MISNEDRERIARLPTWARDLIKRLETANEPMANECIQLRRKNSTAQERAKSLSESNEALLELLRCAGRGGSEWAATVVKTLEGYEIFQNKIE